MFNTEPNLSLQAFEHIFKIDHELASSPGFIFLALMKKSGAWGPRIYNHHGNLVWHGSSSIGNTRITDFHPCSYFESTNNHLCWHDEPTGGRLEKIIVDNSYSLVHNLTTRGDHHEFHMVDEGKSFVTMEYRAKPWDLSPYCGLRDGWIQDACILEYDARSGQKSWEWCFTDHRPVHDSRVYFLADKACQKNDTAPKAGRGTRKIPWDFAHLNAVDKDAKGDYIASFRHMDEIMKISGPSNPQFQAGTILWRLGGRHNQFQKNFIFSRQHMVRFVDGARHEEEQVIALFNNAWEGVLEPSADVSSGQVIRVDTKNMQAELLHEYPHPHGKLTESRGSMQVLPNGNVFIGWGNLPEVSEFTENETLIFHGQFAPYNSAQYSYRAFKSEWIGNPTWPPKLFAYSQTCRKSSPLFAYASWNGATQVEKWRFYTAAYETGPWTLARVSNTTSFETMVPLDDSTASFVSTEAMGADEKILGTATVSTFVPPRTMMHNCDLYACVGDTAHGQTCDPGYLSGIYLLAILILLEWFVEKTMQMYSNP